MREVLASDLKPGDRILYYWGGTGPVCIERIDSITRETGDNGSHWYYLTSGANHFMLGANRSVIVVD